MQFEQGFFHWVQSINDTIAGVVAIDGKTLRRLHDHTTGNKVLHIVSAWAAEHRLVLAQVAVEEKSNEITAIPLLLRQLALSGCIVTSDAMGTQTEIAKQIVDDDGDYALALKGRLNQGQSFSYTFTSPGTFQYNCSVHPSMIAVVTVSR